MSEGTRTGTSEGASSGVTRKGVSPPGLLSRFPRVRPAATDGSRQFEGDGEDEHRQYTKATSSTAGQQAKSKRRKGSLRKEVLGREAQREKRDAQLLTINTTHDEPSQLDLQINGGSAAIETTTTTNVVSDSDRASESDVTPWPSLDDAANSGRSEDEPAAKMRPAEARETLTMESALATSPTISYNSTTTTDDEDGLHMPQPAAPLHRPDMLAAGTSSYFTRRALGRRRPTSQVAKSPLSYGEVGLATAPVQGTDSDWDYTETEWWGWVVLVVTWFVFVTGMGSCFGMWSWAWDVGTTPYAPPELENDETLPIVGYYPALLILTGVMSWIWVIIAWVGMKYFRHAKITGD